LPFSLVFSGFLRFFLFHISFPRKEIGRAGEAARKKNKKK